MIGPVLIAVLSATIAFGASPGLPRQTPESSGSEPGAGRAAGALSPGEVVAMLDAYALVQAQETLQLSDTQYAPFVARLKKLQETRRRNQQAHNQLVQELRKL